MYDNIRLIMQEPFKSITERSNFISRFALFIKDEKKGIYHNKGYEALEQNKGVYLRLEAGAGIGLGRLALSFSLHKFYNAMQGRKLINYNSFSFEDANEASRMLSGLLCLDLSDAVVKKYEIGINVPTEKPPDIYLKELDYMEIKGRKIRILEDIHYKEYKQYSTNKDKGKRIVYIFYNKTYEARSKTKNETRKYKIPKNILRVEMDVQRPSEKITFSRLFDTSFQSVLFYEFRQRFTLDLHYKELLVKTAGLTSKQVEVYNRIRELGAPGAAEYYQNLYRRKVISRDQYRYAVSQIKAVQEKTAGFQVSISPDAAYLSEQISGILTKNRVGNFPHLKIPIISGGKRENEYK